MPEAGTAVIDNKLLANSVLESIIGKNGVSPVAKQSLASRLSSLFNDFGEKAAADNGKVTFFNCHKMSTSPSVTEIQVENIIFPSTVKPPGSTKTLFLGGAG